MKQRTDCPICSSPGELIFSLPYSDFESGPYFRLHTMKELLEGKEYQIFSCPVCTTLFQSWVLEHQELQSWYSGSSGVSGIKDEIENYKLHWFAHIAEEILIVRQLQKAKSPKILDFGCNWGKFASMALAFGCEVYGVEVNPVASDFCENRGIQMLNPDALPDEEFDFINVSEVLEHLSDPLGTMQSLARAIKPGGHMKVSTPGNKRLPGTLIKAQKGGYQSSLSMETLDSLAPLEHVNLFTNYSLKLLAQRAGLETARLPFPVLLGAGLLWNIPRQIERNIRVPIKRWRCTGTNIWFKKSDN